LYKPINQENQKTIFEVKLIYCLFALRIAAESLTLFFLGKGNATIILKSINNWKKDDKRYK